MGVSELIQKFEDDFSSVKARFREVRDDRLRDALKYTLEGSGKRIRPVLAMLTGAAYRGDWQNLSKVAIAVELIHTYSLVHDDLPCMDDDDMRRGRPTVHVQFDEATAVLVGDALLTEAFAVLGELSYPDAVRMLAHAVGASGLIGGQSTDIVLTGSNRAFDLDEVLTIHREKTGCLMGAACGMAALVSNANAAEVDLLRNFGEEIGVVFQLQDDLLDGLQGTGKTRGKDVDQGKLTILKFKSREEAEIYTQELMQTAITKLPASCTDLARYVSSWLGRTA